MDQEAATELLKKLSERTGCRKDSRGDDQCMALVEARKFYGVPFDTIALTYKAGAVQGIAFMSALPRSPDECSSHREELDQSLEFLLDTPLRAKRHTGWSDDKTVLIVRKGSGDICWRAGYSSWRYSRYLLKQTGSAQ